MTNFLDERRVALVTLGKQAGFPKLHPYAFTKDDKKEIKSLLEVTEGGKVIIAGGDILCVADEEREFESKRRTKALYTLHVRLHFSNPEDFQAEKEFEKRRRAFAALVRFSEEVFPEDPSDDGMQNEGQVIVFGNISTDTVAGQRWWSTIGVVRVVEQFTNVPST